MMNLKIILCGSIGIGVFVAIIAGSAHAISTLWVRHKWEELWLMVPAMFGIILFAVFFLAMQMTFAEHRRISRETSTTLTEKP